LLDIEKNQTKILLDDFAYDAQTSFETNHFEFVFLSNKVGWVWDFSKESVGIGLTYSHNLGSSENEISKFLLDVSYGTSFNKLCLIGNVGFLHEDYRMNIKRQILPDFFSSFMNEQLFINTRLIYDTESGLTPFAEVGLIYRIPKDNFSAQTSFHVSMGCQFNLNKQNHLTDINSFGSDMLTVNSVYNVSLPTLGPGTPIAEKPNIYLYPEKTQKINIQICTTNTQKVIKSMPNYDNGWNVIISSDGLIDSKYRYLFYEANLERYPKVTKGWCIQNNQIREFFNATLEKYGFNEHEIKDFVEYWSNNLHDSEYYFVYPLIAKDLERIMPIKIEPSPDSLLRVWFVIESVNKDRMLEEPQISSFERKGFIVAEWGVILK
jgi:hypothetical protein